ncbi:MULTISPECIES: DUF2752 domain-containing protein [Nocardia]|uniref:DUF2752 domain-containing protein n=1 Tax=Nocardia TaxID=1817 RepID=UPI0006885E32|nr:MULTISPECIES: DUF2752 domain-containing protein [Nocardia]
MNHMGFRHTDSVVWATWTAAALLAVVVVLAVAGVPSADLHGPLHRFGIMDPACGGTRSVYLFSHGDLVRALRYNPAGPIVVLAAALLAVRAVAGRLTGRWLTVAAPRHLVLLVAGIGLLALEVNQQAHADLLTSSWTG